MQTVHDMIFVLEKNGFQSQSSQISDYLPKKQYRPVKGSIRSSSKNMDLIRLEVDNVQSRVDLEGEQIAAQARKGGENTTVDCP